jgi:AAHS family 4-hydroxybenzoate transporter-like MFS transporter
VIVMGYSLGTALGGPIAIWLIPKFGWKSVFVGRVLHRQLDARGF